MGPEQLPPRPAQLDTNKEEKSNTMETRVTKGWLTVWLSLWSLSPHLRAQAAVTTTTTTAGGGGGGSSSSSGGSKAPGGTIKVGTIGSIAGIGGVFRASRPA